ncbi:MAG: DUF998 domain-containing protein [Infirmifilum uzonense]|jgi:hypothetical membrane protein|uniref:DUF998 domain-containing protein n=1 Tax=Infirmifilum uzonense TaxID=1550241 RepID=UPI003C77CF09
MKTIKMYLLAAGPLAFVAFTLGVLVSASQNTWWSLIRNAFSDLGGPRATDPWIFNWTLIISGILYILYSMGVLAYSRSRLDSFSAGLLFTAGIFLALIGVYPSGTRPHTFVSTWFYIQSLLGISVLGLSFLLQRKRQTGIILLGLGVSAIPLAYLVHVTVGWPSVAILELAGAIFILAAAITHMVSVILSKE